VAPINANYPRPVLVNGYECDNCADVAKAKKGVDPHERPGNAGAADPASAPRPAFTLGGTLASSASDATLATPRSFDSGAAGSVLDIRA
jgi:hypothetical protein